MKTILFFIFCLLTTSNCYEIRRSRRGISEVTEQGNEVISHLSEINSYFKETKFTLAAGKILNSAGFVGALVSTVLSFTTEEEEDTRLDEIITKIDTLTEEMHTGFEGLKNEVNKAKDEIIAFMEKSNFRSHILLPTEDLTDHVYQYLKHPNSANKAALKTLCEQKTPKSLLNNMKTIIFDDGVTEQLVAQDYTDASFEHLQNLYRSMIMQILVAHPICENLLHGTAKPNELEARYTPIKDAIKKIEERFVGENNGRKQRFWDKNIMERLMKKNMDTSSDKDTVRTAIYNDLVAKYSLTGYRFGVGVYSSLDDVQYRGNTISVTNYNGMSAFVMCTESAPSYQTCIVEHRTNYMPQQIEYIYEMCPNLPAVVVWKPQYVYANYFSEGFYFHNWNWGGVGALIARHPA